MAYPYVYLSLIPNLITIAFLIFNNNAQKNYNTKKAGIELSTNVILMATIFTWHIISSHCIFTKINISQYPLWFFLGMFGLGILAPVAILSCSKINRKETIFDKKWFQILFGILLIVAFFLISFFIMA